jgi:recombination protein RecA
MVSALSVAVLRRLSPSVRTLSILRLVLATESTRTVSIAVAFANPETTTGGNALKFYASVRLDVRRVGQVKAGENNVGNRTRVKVVKNKMAPPFGTCEFDIRFGSGIDGLGDLLDIATEMGIVNKNGAYYTYGDESLGQGRERARALLIERPDLFAKIEAQVLGKESKVESTKEAKAA